MTALELQFFDEQKGVKEAVETELEGLIYSKRSEDGAKVYEVSNSPISEVWIYAKKFILKTNPDKWEGYF